MKQKTTPITINILDKEYRIACPEEEQDNLLQTSTLLNQKMRDTQARGHIFGSERIAVMTALNITHEHLQNRQQQQTTDRGMLSAPPPPSHAQECSKPLGPPSLWFIGV